MQCAANPVVAFPCGALEQGVVFYPQERPPEFQLSGGFSICRMETAMRAALREGIRNDAAGQMTFTSLFEPGCVAREGERRRQRKKRFSQACLSPRTRRKILFLNFFECFSMPRVCNALLKNAFELSQSAVRSRTIPPFNLIINSGIVIGPHGRAGGITCVDI